jgi:hypothetical protein
MSKHRRHSGAGIVAVVALALATLAPGRAAGEAPSIVIDDLGNHLITVSTPGIYDFSLHEDEVSPQKIHHTTTVVQDARGRIKGTGRDYDGQGFDVRHVFNGWCRTKDGLTAVARKITSAGSFGSGNPREYRSVGVLKGSVHGFGADARLVGTVSGRVCAKIDPSNPKGKTLCSDNSVQVTYPLANVGDWLIDMSIDRVGERIIGAASITTSLTVAANRRTFEVSVNGKIDAGNVATIMLRPLNGATGLGWVRLRGPVVYDPVLDVPTLVAVDEVKGELLGQKFNEAY